MNNILDIDADTDDSNNLNINKIKMEQSRTFKINSLVNSKGKHLKNYSKSNFKKNSKQKSEFSKLSMFFQHFDHFIDESLERKKQFLLWCNNVKNKQKDNITDIKIQTDLIGLEQQIIGAISFYKNYRLDCVKMIEIPFIAVHKNFQRLTIGTKLLQVIIFSLNK